ncbi:lysozyme inhibitor LprI family protein [Novosphingobium sp. 9]|uniref:lysozyme inhibitor LprI family protein n=1 Tax=Novosphingobium sp. 9 TaxID=2025349 RepID=UPI0021B555BA|nr:DUF1311 domain-containing protein [Novosphingobium sp. 9]
MIFTALVLAAAAPSVPLDCSAVSGALAQDKCQLAQSMAMKDPAPDCAGQGTQFDMNVCSYRDYLRADIALNETWQQLSKGRDAAGLALHRDAQRKWLAYRDAQCLAENGRREDSGTIWPLLQNTCLEGMTKNRTQELRAYLEEDAKR